MEELIRQYLISGRVQGVGFRAFTQRTAQELGLRGWVRNLDDGRVEALACGPGPQVASFESRLKAGPPRARVEQFSARTVSRSTELTNFIVKEDGDSPWEES